MGFDLKEYVEMIEKMTIRELREEQRRQTREWSGHTTRQYMHGTSALVTGPYGVIKSFRHGSKGMDAARKSSIIDTRLRDLECYEHPRVRDYAIPAGGAIAARGLGYVASDLADDVFSDMDPSHHYSQSEKLARKGIGSGVEKGSDKIIGRMTSGGSSSVTGCRRICDGCREDLSASELWYRCKFCDEFNYCPSCWLEKARGVEHPELHKFDIKFG